MPLLGRWMGRFWIRRMMFVHALGFIFVYLLYGAVVWLIVGRMLPNSVWPVMVVYGMFVLDRLSMQIGVVRAVYLRSIAVTPEEITSALSPGVSLDHTVSILVAQASGLVWTY